MRSFPVWQTLNIMVWGIAMLTQNRVIKVETCSIHIAFGCTYKYAVSVFARLPCRPRWACSSVLCWLKLSFFASKLVALRTFNQSHSCRFFCEAYILTSYWLDISHGGTRLHFWPLLCDSAWESYLAMINKKQLLRQFTTSNQTARQSLILMHPLILPNFVDHPSSKAPLPLI